MSALAQDAAEGRVLTLSAGLVLAFALTAMAQTFNTMAVESYDNSFREEVFNDSENWREVEGDENTWRLETTPEPRRSTTDRMRLIDDDRAYIGRRLYGSRSGRNTALDPY